MMKRPNKYEKKGLKKVQAKLPAEAIPEDRPDAKEAFDRLLDKVSTPKR